MDWNDFEDSWLAPYAIRSRESRGRRHAEPPDVFRTVYQRDRDRIVHSSAFRRLMGKTQVLAGQINDHHRTRLTHSLEVAQISRTVARRLRLNEDLAEAIALSHDLGHPPFGHTGEQTLAECVRQHGGFDHNLFGLRRVDLLEERYPAFPGLNLSWEVREAFVHHSRCRDRPECRELLSAGGPLLEAQVVDACDSLAYDAHDTDDALGIGLITVDDLADLEIWRQLCDRVRSQFANLQGELLRTAVIRELIAWQVNDLIAETSRRLQERKIGSLADVRTCTRPLAGFGPEMLAIKGELEKFLYERVYRHHRVMRLAAKGRTALQRLFAELVARPELLPERHLARWLGAPASVVARVPVADARREASIDRVAVDYLAGMTDRFVRQECLRLFQRDDDL